MNYIEITRAGQNEKSLINLDKLRCVYEDAVGNAILEFSNRRITTRNSYYEISNKIFEIQKQHQSNNTKEE